jgi:DNA-binding transcriptional regulator PaaX
MTKVLRIQDRILLGIAFAFDVLDEARLVGGVLPQMYRNLYGWVPPQYQRANLYSAVSYSLKTGLIEKVVKEGKPFFRLTGQGREKLIRDFPLFRFQAKKWDGFWTVLFFDIREIERIIRDLLRKDLKTLTFAMAQRSVYVTPHDIALDLEEYLKFTGLSPKVLVFHSKRIFGGDEKAWARKLWKLDKLNRLYHSVLTDWEKIKKGKEEGKGEGIKLLKNKFLQAVTLDPCLPRELLPKDWTGFKARKLITSFSRLCRL